MGSTPASYLLILLVPITALTPDIVYKAVRTTVQPDIIDRARAKEQGKTKQVKPSLTNYQPRYLPQTKGSTLHSNDTSAAQ